MEDMTRNPKVVLICVLCIFLSGILVSYKSFEIHESYKKETNSKMGQEISAWVAETVEHKLSQLESSVSYLDKSTVESLKRMGARYFAYAYKKNDTWEIKWKVLNDQFAKDKILSEVNALEFDKVSTLERTWMHSPLGQLIYVAPVGLAKSHQLISGFLVFGIDKSFFSYVNHLDDSLVLVDKNLTPIHKKLNKKELKNSHFFNSENLSLGTYYSKDQDVIKAYTSYFTPTSQLWIVNQRKILQGHYFTSPYIAYALIGSLIISILFLILSTQWRESRKLLAKIPLNNTQLPSINFLKDNFSKLKTYIDKQRLTKAQFTEHAIGEIEKDRIDDFSEFLDEILVLEIERLKKLGISIKTRVEDHAKIFASKKHLEDIIKRLIGNSALALEFSQEKEIQIQLVETAEIYQLIYVDSRTEHFPSGHEPSLFLQTEGSMVGIDGIISYASWLYGPSLHVAKKGFCFSIDLEKYNEAKVSEANAKTVVPFVDTLDRIEISDHDTDADLMNLFVPIQKGLGFIEDNAESERVKDNMAELQMDSSTDSSFESFELRDINFKDLETQLPDLPIEIEKNNKIMAEPTNKIQTDSNGMFELNNGHFKLKIRSPKKRDMDVDR
jgi:hypothetical protein